VKTRIIILVLSLALLSLGSGPALPETDPLNRQQDAEGHFWWQHAVFYEIYPRSYADTNGDGIGDLNGITAHLDHLKSLGIDAIWITPCFPSPQVDFGYRQPQCFLRRESGRAAIADELPCRDAEQA